jgi:hypothetical protein
MPKFFTAIILVLIVSTTVSAQQADTTANKPEDKKSAGPSPVYYGGTIGLSFGDYFRIAIMPLVGYKLSEKTSAGFKLGYEYVVDSRYDEKLTAHNYGASIFGRYRIIPNAYLHAEFAYFSYKYKVKNLESERTWVPFIYLGGGYIQPIGPSTSLIVEVLFDVLQDNNSPYEPWDPVISIGVASGF